MVAIVAHGAMTTGIGIADRATTATGSRVSVRNPIVKLAPVARAIAVTMATRADRPGDGPFVEAHGNGAAGSSCRPVFALAGWSVPGFSVWYSEIKIMKSATMWICPPLRKTPRRG